MLQRFVSAFIRIPAPHSVTVNKSCSDWKFAYREIHTVLLY